MGSDGSGGVASCFGFSGDGEIHCPFTGEGDFGTFWSGDGGVSADGAGGAREPLLDLDLTWSRSTFRNGSGSAGSMFGLSSRGLAGSEDLVSHNRSLKTLPSEQISFSLFEVLGLQ